MLPLISPLSPAILQSTRRYMKKVQLLMNDLTSTLTVYNQRCLPKGYILNVPVQYACVLPPGPQIMLSRVTSELPNWFSVFQVPVF